MDPIVRLQWAIDHLRSHIDGRVAGQVDYHQIAIAMQEALASMQGRISGAAINDEISEILREHGYQVKSLDMTQENGPDWFKGPISTPERDIRKRMDDAIFNDGPAVRAKLSNG